MSRKPSEKSAPRGCAVDRDALQGALSHAARSASPKSTIPVLGCILVDGEGRRLRLTGTDLYVASSDEVPYPDEAALSCCVSSRDILAAARAMPAGFLTLREERSVSALYLVVESASSARTIRIRAMPAEDFPKISRRDPGLSWTDYNPMDLSRALGCVLPAVSSDVTQPNKNAVLFDPLEGGGTALVSTDGHRVHVAAVGDGGSSRILLPLSAAERLSAMIGGSKESEVLRLAISGGGVFFSQGEPGAEISLWAKLVEDQNFPPYRQVMPPTDGPSFLADVGALSESVRAARVMVGEKTDGVLFELKSGRLLVSSEASERGTVADAVSVAGEHPPATVKMSARYVLDALSAVTTERARFWFRGSLDPVSVEDESGDAFSCVVMPMRSVG